MQPEALSRLTMLKSVRYTSRAGSACDFSKSPRPFFFLAAMESGSAVFESSTGEKINFKSGGVIFIPQGAKYRSFWGEIADNVYISLRFELENGAALPSPDTLMLQSFPDDICKILSDRLFAIHTLLEKGTAEGFLALSLFYECLSLILPLLKRTARPTNDRRLLPAIEHIRTHLCEQTPVCDLAALCHMSEPNLYLLFRNSLGTSPVEYRNRLRTERAMQLLLSDAEASIEEIASAVGFESAAYFRRRFKQITGESPRDFRKRSCETL